MGDSSLTLERHFTEGFKLPPDAVAWLIELWQTIQVFDDLADGGEVKRADLDAAIWSSLVGLQSQTFYVAHAPLLQPVLALAILKWKASDDAERAGTPDERSFVWRASYYDVVLMTVFICHGYSTAMESAVNVMKLYGEDFAAYRTEFGHA
jgi:hypothetical protein